MPVAPSVSFKAEFRRLLVREALAELTRHMSAPTFQTLYRYWIDGAQDPSRRASELRRAKEFLRKLLQEWPDLLDNVANQE